MSGKKRRGGLPSKLKMSRIRPPEAEAILNQCRDVLAKSSDLLANLRTAGLGGLLARLDEKVLALALQPDAWGERARAALMSELSPALAGNPEATTSIDGLVATSVIVMPCILLEIGRRKQNIQVEFPTNPTDAVSTVKIRLGPSNPIHLLNSDQMMRLLAVADAALVGLCYFGDAKSRAEVEAELSLTSDKPRTCRTQRSPETEN
jgi:hypothetical protein